MSPLHDDAIVSKAHEEALLFSKASHATLEMVVKPPSKVFHESDVTSSRSKRFMPCGHAAHYAICTNL